jgi:hypothetical protein
LTPKSLNTDLWLLERPDQLFIVRGELATETHVLNLTSCTPGTLFVDISFQGTLSTIGRVSGSITATCPTSPDSATTRR